MRKPDAGSNPAVPNWSTAHPLYARETGGMQCERLNPRQAGTVQIVMTEITSSLTGIRDSRERPAPHRDVLRERHNPFLAAGRSDSFRPASGQGQARRLYPSHYDPAGGGCTPATYRERFMEIKEKHRTKQERKHAARERRRKRLAERLAEEERRANGKDKH